MSEVAIKKVNDTGKKTLPIFEEIARRFEAVQRRAFDLFEKRGRELGHELEDWLKAERELMGCPAAELAKKNGAYELQITLPGFEAKDIEVTAMPRELIVHATTEEEKRTEKGNVMWTEFGSNDVYRKGYSSDQRSRNREAQRNQGSGCLVHRDRQRAAARRLLTTGPPDSTAVARANTVFRTMIAQCSASDVESGDSRPCHAKALKMPELSRIAAWLSRLAALKRIVRGRSAQLSRRLALGSHTRKVRQRVKQACGEQSHLRSMPMLRSLRSPLSQLLEASCAMTGLVGVRPR
jgi:HSP20 family molecular chaperone IbpA